MSIAASANTHRQALSSIPPFAHTTTPPASRLRLSPKFHLVSHLSPRSSARTRPRISPALRCSATESPGARSAVVGVIRGISSAFRALSSAMSGSPSPAFSPEQRWWTPDTVAVVTGSNKGIGLAIIRGLSKAGLKTVLTARNPSLGEEALSALQKEGLQGVVFHQLDIADSASTSAFAEWVKSEFGGVDILVNNAGMAHKGNVFGHKEAEETVGVNYRGTRNITESLLPLLRASAHGARVVNVCSRAGLLKIVSPDLQKRLTDPGLTVEQLDALALEFVSSIEKGDYREKGWPQSMYGVSKVIESAYTRVLACQLHTRPDGHRVFVNACSPGYVATDMSSHMGYLTPDQGADTPIFLALRPASECTTGAMFAERKEISF